jgi:transposase
MYYMGIDHHNQFSHLTIMDERGHVIKAGRIPNRCKDVECFVTGLEGQLEAVIESGRSSYTMVDMLEDLGVKVKIAHPYEVKAIAKAKIKTDKRDSMTLAHLLRTNYIPEVYRRERSNRETQRVLRHRMGYVRMQTSVKNRVRVLLSQQREEVREMAEIEGRLFGTKGMAMLRELELRGEDTKLLDSLLDTFEHLREKIRCSDRLVDQIYAGSEEARLISTVPGFGKFLSVLVATEISDVKRFASESKLHSYAGLVPSTQASGGKVYHGRLVRQGNKWLRWAMVEAVWPAVRSDFNIRLFNQKAARRKGVNSAKVKTARRLLTIIYRIMKEKRAYVPYKRQ